MQHEVMAVLALNGDPTGNVGDDILGRVMLAFRDEPFDAAFIAVARDALVANWNNERMRRGLP